MRMSWELSFLCSWVQTRHDHSIETAVRYTTQNITTLRHMAFLCVTRQRNTPLKLTYLEPNCTALHYIMTTLYFTEPQRSTLHYTTQVHTTPHHSGNVTVHYTTSRHPTSHHTKLHSTAIPHYITSHSGKSHHSLRHATPYYTTPHYIILSVVWT